MQRLLALTLLLLAPAVALQAQEDESVLVPEGPFLAGCNEAVDPDCSAGEKPSRTLYFKAFRIDRTEVTLSAYEACVEAGACTVPGEDPGCMWGAMFASTYPINCVDAAQARAYCAWKGKRLPTSHEWEKAARGTDGRRFPWGNDTGLQVPAVLAPADAVAPVGSHVRGASPFGALDMAGNVAEWTSSPWDSKRYEVRGGGFASAVRFGRTSSRLGELAGARKSELGFRCVQ